MGAKIFRMIRLTKAFQMFDSLNLMVCALKASISIASWSLLLLASLTVIVALILNYITKGYILDLNSISESQRADVFEYFGTMDRSLLSVWELTLGNWVPVVRMVHETISAWLAFALVAYQMCVGFAIVKIISGVFLHETFKVAGNDDELMMLQKHRETQKYQERLGILLQEADDSGDGILTDREFDEALKDTRMKEWLASMGFEISDARAAWNLMDQEKKGLRLEALSKGLQRIKGAAKSLGVAMLRSDVERLHKAMCRLEQRMPHTNTSPNGEGGGAVWAKAEL